MRGQASAEAGARSWQALLLNEVRIAQNLPGVGLVYFLKNTELNSNASLHPRQVPLCVRKSRF